MLIRPTAFTIGLIIYSFIALFFVYTEFGIDSINPRYSNNAF
jgi:membrane-anchored glycerophosphoryl diester phosphodiesterase (GDPDase)